MVEGTEWHTIVGDGQGHTWLYLVEKESEKVIASVGPDEKNPGLVKATVWLTEIGGQIWLGSFLGPEAAVRAIDKALQPEKGISQPPASNRKQ